MGINGKTSKYNGANAMVIITGDIHNDFGSLNTLINRKKPELLICCGDFGYWPKFSQAKQFSDIKNPRTKILWCDGNHEDHWSLRDRTTDELAPNVIYMPRGSTYTLPDGRNILFMGGGYSIDKAYRTEGVDWFREETISQKDFENLPDMKIDIVVSHTCPEELVDRMILYNSYKKLEPSNTALSRIWNMYNPSLWFFGHWHNYVEITMKDTKFYALDHTQNQSKWWMKLD